MNCDHCQLISVRDLYSQTQHGKIAFRSSKRCCFEDVIEHVFDDAIEHAIKDTLKDPVEHTFEDAIEHTVENA